MQIVKFIGFYETVFALNISFTLYTTVIDNSASPDTLIGVPIWVMETYGSIEPLFITKTLHMQYKPQSYNSPKSQKRSSPIWMTILTMVILAFGVFIETAHAGFFSFVKPMLGESQAATKQSNTNKIYNLQNLALLQAATNIDPNPNKVAEIVPVNKGDILIADIASSEIDNFDDYNTQISTYIVREGDTVSSIAKMFNVSINTVLWANNLNSRSILKPGNNLIILPVSGISYTIKKGDSISTIAKKYKADVNDILNYNDITISSPLTVGEIILIPDAELSATDIARSNPSSQVSKNNYPSYSGYYIRPIPGGRKSQGQHGNNGVDLASPIGTPIVASAQGTIIISKTSGWNGGYGNYVVISHPNGTQTLYSHMSTVAVSVGEKVAQGETIGHIGMTGRTTGPHVHFEIRGAKNPF